MNCSKDFPDSSPDSISVVSLAQLARSCKTETVIAESVRKGKQDEGT
jgi:hypothetical protein